ncbi:hypothetical protein BX283_0937 [Streptomyces sp. TLI_146]|nr:hypothetical protein BX283_0937 [Streptomyces sp. TLI_146]
MAYRALCQAVVHDRHRKVLLGWHIGQQILAQMVSGVRRSRRARKWLKSVLRPGGDRIGTSASYSAISVR